MKPCPFCGETETSVCRSEVGRSYWIRCNVCKTEGPVAVTGNEDEAESLWNNRPENNSLKNIENEANDVPEPLKKEISDMFARRGLPGDIQREIFKSTVYIFKKYRGMRKSHMSRFRILGLAVESLKYAWACIK